MSESVLKQAFDYGMFGQVTPLDPDRYPRPMIKPYAKTHPRLVINREIIEKVKRIGATGENERAYRLMLSLSEEETDGVLPPPEEGKHYNPNFHVLHCIEARAFRYALEGDEQYGIGAVSTLRNFLATVEITDSANAGGRDAKGYMNDSYNAWGYMMYITSEVYDWCYPLLTNLDKRFFISAVENKISRGLEVGYPPTGQGSVTGHGSENQLLRDWLSFAIATYDDAPDVYDFVMGRIESEYIAIREFFYRSGMHGQGNSYGPCRLHYDNMAQWLIRISSGETLFRVNLGETFESFIHNIRPDGSMLRVGDDVPQRSDTYSLSNVANIFFYAGAVNRNSVLKGVAKEINPNLDIFLGKGQYDQYITPCQFLAFNDPTLSNGTKGDLPLGKYFGSPVGQIIARDGWGEDGCLLYMKLGEYFTANHEHKDVGSFLIYFGGSLAIDSGFYDKYGTAVHFSYTMSTLAHNSVLIYDPNEDTGNYVNVGGQKSSCRESKSLIDWLGKEYTKRATVLGHQIVFGENGKPKICYLAGDMTDAYTKKAERVIRNMLGVFTGKADMPLVFFVYDRITASDPSFKKTVLLHMMEEPTVSGNLTSFSHGGGTLVNRTLLPKEDQVEITVVEGPYTGVAPENAVTRCNDKSKASERGWGRVEISPKVGEKTNEVFNAMYVTETSVATASQYLQCRLVENGAVMGTSLGGAVVFFAKSEKPLSDPFQVEGEGIGVLTYAVGGLEFGFWNVTDEAGIQIGRFEVTSSSGLLTFEAPKGIYIISKE